MVEHLYTLKLYGLLIDADGPMSPIVDSVVAVFVFLMREVLVTLGMKKDWEGINFLVIAVEANESVTGGGFDVAEELVIPLTLKVDFGNGSIVGEGFELAEVVTVVVGFKVLFGKGE